MSAAPANPAQVTDLRARIHKVLCDYNMSNFVFDDDDHAPYPLKDLCTPDGEGIDKGEEELFLIADEIAAAIGAGGQAVAPAGWFNQPNDFHGYQQVAKEFEGSPGTIPLYTHPVPSGQAVVYPGQFAERVVAACRAYMNTYDVLADEVREHMQVSMADALRDSDAIAHPVQPGWRDRENFTPFLWECKDYADDWIRYFREDEALAYQRDTDCLLRVTYRPAAPQPKGE